MKVVDLYTGLVILDNISFQALYGQKPARPTPATQRPETGGGPRGGGASGGSLCRDASIDAIVTMSDKETYVFKGRSNEFMYVNMCCENIDNFNKLINNFPII